MKKVLIFLVLTGCKLNDVANFDASNQKSITSEPRIQTVSSRSLPQVEPKKLWISNLQSSDIYYWDGSESLFKKATITEEGSFATTNSKGQLITEYYLSEANSSTEAVYYLKMFADGKILEQYNGILKITTQKPKETAFGHLYKEVVELTYSNNIRVGHLIDGYTTDILYRNP